MSWALHLGRRCPEEVQVPVPWTACVKRTLIILDAQSQCVLKPAVREMVSKVYTFLMTLGLKDL